MTPKLTNAGYALMVGALSGGTIQFTKIKLGTGDAPADYKVLTELNNPVLTVGLSGVTKESNYALLQAPMSNVAMDDGFNINEIGVFASDPDGGDDILYAYGHWELSGDKQPLYLPPVDHNLVDVIHQVYAYVGEAENITAIVAASANYASAAELKSHKDDKGNPHNVTARDVGLDKVQNATPGDMTPAFNEALVPTTIVGSAVSFTNIYVGETLGVMLQKIRSAIALLIGHFNAKNPHKTTAKDIGAAASTHTHSAGDINKGTLSVLRGGTGGNTPNAAKLGLEIQSGEAVVECKIDTNTSVEVEFPVAFASRIPTVVLTPRAQADNLVLDFAVSGETKTGFTIYVRSHNITGEVTFAWVAL